MADAAVASIQIDLPADKALRLERLRLAHHALVWPHQDVPPADEIVARAEAYSSFVLTETRGSSNVDVPRFLGVDLAAARTPGDVVSRPRSVADNAAETFRERGTGEIWMGHDPAEQVPPEQASGRAWRYRLLDFGTAHDGTPRGLGIVEVWHVDGRPIVRRGDSIELFDGRLLDEPISAAATRLGEQVRRCVEAVSLPVLTHETIRLDHHTDYPTSTELLELPR